MSIVVQDLIGLNAIAVQDMPIVRDEIQSKAAATGGTSCSIAGMRHSQGGHTALTGGRMLLTETFNQVHKVTEFTAPTDRQWYGKAEVDAGVTWNDLHRALAAHWLAPMVQQSSAHFTIGGSLSVNCHGRDPRCGPISTTVEEITVLTGLGTVVTASRNENADLFSAALGGYGACGQILRATLGVTRNLQLLYVGGEMDIVSMNTYAGRLAAMLNPGAPDDAHLHYGWLCCVPGGDFYRGEMLHVDMKRGSANDRYEQATFLDEAWGTGEILRAGWAASRVSEEIKSVVWKELKASHRGTGGSGDILNNTTKSRIDWLRSSVSFTAFRDDGTADILQEYFVPVGRFKPMIEALRRLYTADGNLVNVLSTTVRVVRQDDETVLSYCRGQPMVCIAVDAHVPTVSNGTGGWDLHGDVKASIAAAIDAALAHGGSYYLPYYKAASLMQFRAAYPRHDVLQAAINKWNPKVGGRHRYWNAFLDAYFV